MASLQLDASDVIKVVLQFLKEHNLTKSFQALQDEANVGFNAVPSVEGFVSDIEHGKWDVVLPLVSSMKLPSEKLIDLYEQVVKEMIEAREVDTARALLRSTVPMAMLREEDGDRYTRLERLLSRPVFEETEAYPDGSNKHARRADIAEALRDHVMVAPASRLLAIIGHSMKWQQHLGLLPPGMSYDVFRAAAPAKKEQREKPAKKMTSAVRFGKDTYPTATKFTPDGQHLVVGSLDGLVEVYDFETGLVDKRLEYQEKEEYMMCEESVLSLACSEDSELIATGCKDGNIKVWSIRSGKPVVEFVKAHAEGVTSLVFSKDSAQLLSGSFDTLARIHGLKSGKTLKEFRGHTSFVNDAKYSADGDMIGTASSDGTVKLWDVRSTECLRTFLPPQVNLVTETVCNNIWFLPHNRDRLLVCNKTSSLYIMSVTGELLATLSSDMVTSRFVAALVSPKGKYVYGLTEDNQLLCFSLADNTLVAGSKAPEGDAVGLSHHPHMNMIATTSAAGVMRIWRS